MEKTHKQDNTYSELKCIVLFHPLLYPCLFLSTGSVLRGSKMCLIMTFSRPSKLRVLLRFLDQYVCHADSDPG